MRLTFDAALAFKAILAAGFCFALLTVNAQTNAILPTVTVAMGDVGGKIHGHPPEPGTLKHYYIAAEPSLWDFVPGARDVVCGMALPPPVMSNHASMKVRYVAYTDATFSRRMPENPSLGILGPVLRGLVGENLAITFLNRADIPLSLHPHGVKYDKDSEGSYYQPRPGLGAAIAPGAKFTYVWQLDESSGPLPSEPSSKAWLYHSHVNGDAEVNLGLMGFIIVTDPKRARPNGTPADVDRELGSLFMIFNESGVDPEAEEEAERARAAGGGAPAKSWAQIQENHEDGQRYAINGRIFGSLPGLEMNAGERVRWYLFALGSETDFHTPHWHGLRVVESGRRADVVELLPASMKVADMVADNPGSWLFHCHVAEHMMQGMFASVRVYSTADGFARRAPQPAFLGLAVGPLSLQVTRAEAAFDLAPDAAKACEIKIEGEAIVPEAFAVFDNPLRIELGQRSITFKPGRTGIDEKAEGSLRVENASKNSSEQGLVYGGRLNFSLTLSGGAWKNELVTAGWQAGLPDMQDLALPLLLETGGAQDRATIHISTISR